jgi:hypothetical protein
MQLSEEFKQSGKLLADKGFTDEGKLLGKIADSKLEFYVLVNEGLDSPVILESSKCVFLDKSKAEQAALVATCQFLRDGDNRYQYYALDAANERSKNHSESDISRKANAIFGKKIDFRSEKFKLPKDATDEQLIEFSQYMGYTPIILQKVKLEV